MHRKKCPVSIAILSWIYIVVGILGFAHNFHGLLAMQQDALWAEITELIAIVCGVFMMRGKNWARWLALAWIAFHVVLSAFHDFHEFAIHGLICAVIAWILFRGESARYFRSEGSEPGSAQ